MPTNTPTGARRLLPAEKLLWSADISNRESESVQLATVKATRDHPQQLKLDYETWLRPTAEPDRR